MVLNVNPGVTLLCSQTEKVYIISLFYVLTDTISVCVCGGGGGWGASLHVYPMPTQSFKACSDP